MPTLPPWVFAIARCYVNVLHGNHFAFMLMCLLCEELHTGAPPFIKKGLFKALGISTGKEGLKQSEISAKISALHVDFGDMPLVLVGNWLTTSIP